MPMPARPADREPTTPTATASTIPAAITWRRVAPTARSSADVRLRCAARIENVL